jgi:hypothetical protein
MDSHIDLAADLNAEDDEGLGWSTLSEGRHPRPYPLRGDAGRR